MKEDLQHQLEQKKDTIAKLEEKVETSNKRIYTLEEQLSKDNSLSLNNKNTSAQQIEQLMAEKDELTKTIESKDLKIEEIMNHLKAKHEECTQYSETIERLQNSMKEAEAKARDETNAVYILSVKAAN